MKKNKLFVSVATLLLAGSAVSFASLNGFGAFSSTASEVTADAEEVSEARAKAADTDAEPVISDYVTTLEDVAGKETECYLYNVEAKALFLGANDWGTRASVSATRGYRVKIDDGYIDGTYRIVDYCEAKSNQWLDTWATSPTDIWVDYVDQPEESKYWVFTATTNGGYNITNKNVGDGKSKLGAGTDTRLYFEGATTKEGATIAIEGYTWYIITVTDYEQFLADHEAWLKAQPLKVGDDIVLSNPNFDGNINGWTDGYAGVSGLNHGFQNNSAYGSINQFMECWAGQWSGATVPYKLPNGYLSQTVTSLPAGKYRLSADVIANQQEIGKNGYVESIDELTGIYLFAGNNYSDALQTGNGQPQRFTLDFATAGGDVEIGLKIIDTNCNWAVIDNVRLTILELGADLSVCAEDLAKEVAVAKAVTGVMHRDVQSELSAAISDNDGTTYTTEQDYTDAIARVKAAVSAANTSIANYEAAVPYVNKASGLDAAGKAKYAEDATVAAVTEAYNTRTFVALTDEQKTAMDAAIITAAKAQTTAGADMTLAIANPTIVNNGANTSCPAGWTESTHSGWSWTKATGDTYMENWNENAVDASFDFHQTITGLPNGTYKVTADMFANRDYQEVEFVSGDYVVYGVSANEAQAGVTVEGGTFNTYVTGDVYVVDGTLVIGVKNVNTPSVRWFGADNFKLTYVATTYPDEYNPEIVAAQKLAKAKDAKTAEIKALTPVGSAIFQYSSNNVAAALQAVEAATTIDEVEAVAMPKVNAPAANQAYQLTSPNGNFIVINEGVKMADVQQPIYFAQNADGEFTISTNGNGNGTEYVVSATHNTWTLTAAKGEGTAYTIVAADGGITIQSADGFFGFNDDEVGASLYRDKGATVFGIAEYVAPAPVPVITDLALTDKVATTAGAGKYNITYTRSFTKANIWQSLFVPFGIDVDEIDLNNVAIAKIDEITRNNDVVTINISKVVAGSTKANTPLFVAVKTAGKYEFKGSELEAGYEVGKSYGDGMVITGVLSEPKTGIAGAYVMDGGKLCTVNYDNNVLPVNRWYMVVMSGDVMAKVRFNIEIDGFDSDEATAIANAVAESVENGEIFSINGAKVKDAKSGLYIKNGKKILVK